MSFKKYYLYKEQISYDNGVTWEDTGNQTPSGDSIGTYETYYLCTGGTPQYRWVQSGTTCVGVDKYQNNIKEKSIDGGITWKVSIPVEYSASTLIESQSTDCGYSATTVSSATYCSNANQYIDIYSIVSTDYGETWVTASTTTQLIQSDCYECGYRTRTTTGETYCSNANKYEYIYSEVSRDSGNTWSTASTSSELVESDSFDCGYRTGTTSSSTYCNGDDLYVDIYHRVSRDSGETWVTASTASTLVEAGGCAAPPPLERWVDTGSYVCENMGLKYVFKTNNGSVYSAECDSSSSITMYDCDWPINVTMTSLTIGDCVTTLEYTAFHGAELLTSVYIPDNVENIEEGVFERCTNVTGITIGSGVKNIGQVAFEGCTSLPNIYIPSGVTNIANGILAGCNSLTSITVDSNNTVYDSRNNCNAIIETSTNTLKQGCKTTIIPSGITRIEDIAFAACSGLTSVTLPDTVTSIGQHAFDGCTGLTSMNIPNSVVTIEGCAFRNCSGLTSVNIPTGLTRIEGSTFISCGRLTGITIPNSVTFIGSMAFEDCDSLTEIVMPNVITIDDFAFEYSNNITSVTIGNSITLIGGSAFRRCTSLTSITINATTPPTIGYQPFRDTNGCPIYVPSGSVDAYKNAGGYWKEYSSRIQAIS